ncbi:hemin uptake protein HemP [Arenibacterium sp. CAU 1754]
MQTSHVSPPAVSARDLSRVSAPPVHQADQLTNGGTLAHIQLADQLYTLRITRAGKLILTK